MGRFAFPVLLAAALSCAVSATTIHVPVDQPTIQAGIDLAVNGDTVLVAPGTYAGSIEFRGVNIVLMSESGRESTKILGDVLHSEIVSFSKGEDTLCKLSGFTIRGTANWSQWGIRISSSSPIIEQCDISFISCPSEGAGIFIQVGSPIIRYNDIHDNATQGSGTGGGMLASSCTAEICYNHIYNNWAPNGSGIGVQSGINGVNIHHNLITDNKGDAYVAGGIYVSGRNNRVWNNTVINNSKGISVLSGEGTVILNNIVAWNQEEGIQPASSLVDYNCVWSNGLLNNPGVHGISGDPLFVDTTQGNYWLSLSSPCIDAGNPDSQYNDVDGSRNDIGAFSLHGDGPDVWIGLNHYLSIQAAINAASPNDTIEVGDGTAFGHLTITKPLMLRSTHGADSTTIDGQNLVDDTTNSVITILGANPVIVDGFSIRGGKGLMSHDYRNARGGGIVVLNSSCRIRNCRLTGNIVGSLDNPVYGWVTGGAAVFSDSGSTLVLENSVIDSCHTADFGYTAFPHFVAGGGVLAFGDSTQIVDCVFRDNTARADGMSASGGAVALMQGHNLIQNCSFLSNSTVSGADGDPVSQYQIGYGGTVAIWGDHNMLSQVNISKSVLAGGADYGNASFQGGGIFISGDWQTISKLEVVSSKITSIVYRDVDAKLRAPNFSVGHIMLGGGACLEGDHISISQCRFDSTEILNIATATGGGTAILDGGGLYFKGSGQLSESRFNFGSGTLMSGGYQGGYSVARGIGCYAEGDIEISNCLMAFNGVFCQADAYAGPTVAHCQGGGLAIVGNPVVRNVLAIGNNVTGQTSDSTGDLLLLGSGIFDSSGSALTNSDLWHNFPTDYFGENWSPGTNGNISADPQFCFPDTGNFYLKASSPCAAGNHESGQTVGAFDVGCYGSDMVRSLGLADGGSLGNVVAQTPKFGWKAYYHPSYTQARFEFAVGTNNDWIYSEMWNPAPFNSSDTFVTYVGAPLVDGQTYYLRLRISDGVSWSNWYYTSFHMNTPPTVPYPYAPTWPLMVGTTPDLSIANSTDAENDTICYDFQVFRDSLLTQLAVEGEHVSETHNPDSTTWTVTPPLDDNHYYYWRARAFDGYEYSEWSAYRLFIVNAFNDPPTAPVLLGPPDSTGPILYNRRPTLRWTLSTDPDPYEQVHYRLQLATDSAFLFRLQIDTVWTAYWIPPDSLPYNSQYWWRVWAIDRQGAEVICPSVKSFWTWTLGDIDHSNNTDIADLSRLIDFLYISLAPITPLKVADFDGDCQVDISDLSWLIDHLYISFTPLGVGCE